MEKVLQKSIATVTVILLGTVFFPFISDAATLSVSPATGSYTVGSTFSVSITAGSSDQAMNAASGVLSFSKDTLEVISLSKNNSVFSLWVQEPTFSNNDGTVRFEGIVLNTGFQGASGKILTVGFRVKSQGTGKISFSSGSILANDGGGTNILQNLGTGSYTLNATLPVPEKPIPPQEAPIKEVAPVESVPLQILDAPLITEYPRSVSAGQPFIIKGRSRYPNARITLSFEKTGGNTTRESVTGDASGNFILLNTKGIPGGTYTVSAVVVDAQGVSGYPSSTVLLESKPAGFIRIGSVEIGARTVLWVCIVLLIMMILLSRKWLLALIPNRKQGRLVSPAERTLHKAFDLLREDVRGQIKSLNKARTKRELTKEEAHIVEHLTKNLDNVEAILEKEIQEPKKTRKQK